MADLIDFELVSPERRLAKAKVAMVVVPGSEGDFGVLAGHAPMMSTIRPGAIAIHETDGGPATMRFFIEGGFAEVSATGLTILAERATPVSEIDVAAVAAELAAARAAGNEANIAVLEAKQAAATN